MKLLELDPKKDTLREHVFRTYQNLRVGLCVIGVLIPFFVWGADYIQSGAVGPRESISAYYHSEHPLTRDLFVGNLFVVGLFLLLYRGYSTMENVVLDVGGIALTFVAIFPTRPEGASAEAAATFIEKVAYREAVLAGIPVTVHGASALVFFAAIAFVAIFLSRETLPETKKHNLAPAYVVCGFLMILAPLAACALGQSRKIFWLETVGILVFSAYWAVKTWEFRGTAGSVEAKLSRS